MSGVLVFVGGQKGGSSKTVLAHFLCLGAILMKQPAAYVLTDPKRHLKAKGRPYSVFDGKDLDKLAGLMAAQRNASNGWLMIDGGGNRPEFDKAMAAQVDLCIVPFKDSGEDDDMVRADLDAIPNAIAWPSAWPTNDKAAAAAQHYIDDLARDYPSRVITMPVSFINSVKELTADELGEPSTIVRSAARRAFVILSNWYDVQKRLQDEAAE